mmetsp:Transcript_21591/g.31410  ORF Transcript_21591/g.31410 Transcript_21591/m.31410 type:complete len:238 (-) Transcript_21591:134-847(-)
MCSDDWLTHTYEEGLCMESSSYAPISSISTSPLWVDSLSASEHKSFSFLDTNLPFTLGRVSASLFLQSYLICFRHTRRFFFARNFSINARRSSFVYAPILKLSGVSGFSKLLLPHVGITVVTPLPLSSCTLATTSSLQLFLDNGSRTSGTITFFSSGSNIFLISIFEFARFLLYDVFICSAAIMASACICSSKPKSQLNARSRTPKNSACDGKKSSGSSGCFITGFGSVSSNKPATN